VINKRNSYLLASIISFLCIILLLQTDFERWNQPGPFNPGHEDLACNECHLKTKSSVRQQLQANVQYLLGQRKTEADFYYHKIDNKHCIACHNMDKDLHSSHRFNEPRFNEVREKIHPEQCISCHKEHIGQRISQFKISDCQLCHEELKIKNDPISVPHDELIERKDWQTCLGCHDYHGNHDMVLEKTVGRAIKQEQLLGYFSNAESPYLGSIITKARSTRYEK
jgi:hypothetical protein